MFLNEIRAGSYFSHIGANVAGIWESRIQMASRLSLLLLGTTKAAEIALPTLSFQVSHPAALLSEQFSQLGNFTMENQTPETFLSFLLASFCADVCPRYSTWLALPGARLHCAKPGQRPSLSLHSNSVSGCLLEEASTAIIQRSHQT